MQTNDIIDKYDISRQTLYEWRKTGILKVEKDWKGHLIWDEFSISQLEKIIQSDRNIPEKKSIEIQNRRYLGSKTRLLPFIQKVIKENTKDINIVADIFGGTGVVSEMFAKMGKSIILNDILHSNVQVYNAFFGSESYNPKIIDEFLTIFNQFKGDKEGYLTKVYGGRYFSNENASKIEQAREFLEQNKDSINQREYSILLTSILYSADKVANTVGHYDAYRKKMYNINPIYFSNLRIDNNIKAEIYNIDANELVRYIKADLVYIDTPYNSRQYVDTYHVLENITDWNKPEVVGVAQKSVDRYDRRSAYNLVKAPVVFDELINNINAKYILVSFNNMSKKGSGRSNAKISNEEIIRTLSKRGTLKIFEQDFMPYTTGKTDIENHKEILYLLEVNQ